MVSYQNLTVAIEALFRQLRDGKIWSVLRESNPHHQLGSTIPTHIFKSQNLSFLNLSSC